MELLASSVSTSHTASFWKNPAAWIRDKNLGRGYWIFFSAAFFFDTGFSIYFFLFNLYLLDHHMNERMMGWIGGALTMGSLVGTLPAGALVRRFGIRPLLVLLFLAAPALNAARAIWVWGPAEVGLAFATGVVMSCWGVCFLPAVARLTTESNRTSGFSLIFSASVGSSMLGGVVCGYLKDWLQRIGIIMGSADVKEAILLLSCGTALLGLFPALRLPISVATHDGKRSDAGPIWRTAWRTLATSPFLIRFLPLMALWVAFLGAFTPFANVYLSRDLHVPMEHIGVIFSTAQVLQLCMGIVTPIVCRFTGLIKGICLTQAVAALVLACMAGARSGAWGVAFYLIFSAAQWMSSPGLYNLLMNETSESNHSNGAALTLFCNALLGSAATAGGGVLFTHFGYPPVLVGLAIFALMIAALFYFLISPFRHHSHESR